LAGTTFAGELHAAKSYADKSSATTSSSKASIESSLDILTLYSHVEMDALAVHRGRIYKCRRNIALVLSH
jgi:hypothetical protein